MMNDDNSRLVYSTDTGRIKQEDVKPQRAKGDGIVRIQRQTSGRKGKGVCLIAGVDLDDAALDTGGRAEKEMRLRRFGERRDYRDPGR